MKKAKFTEEQMIRAVKQLEAGRSAEVLECASMCSVGTSLKWNDPNAWRSVLTADSIAASGFTAQIGDVE